MNEKFKYIPESELFADFQQSTTDIFLLEQIDHPSIGKIKRLKREQEILETIKSIMRERFTQSDIVRFLVHGYPRQVNLSRRTS